MDKRSAIFIIVSFLILIVMFHFIGIENVIDALKKANLGLIALSIGIQIFTYFLYTLRWKLVNDAVNIKVSFRSLFPMMMVGLAVNNITPSGRGGGEPVRAYILSKEEGYDLKDTFAGVVADRVGVGQNQRDEWICRDKQQDRRSDKPDDRAEQLSTAVGDAPLVSVVGGICGHDVLHGISDIHVQQPVGEPGGKPQERAAELLFREPCVDIGREQGGGGNSEVDSRRPRIAEEGCADSDQPGCGETVAADSGTAVE